MTTWRGHSCLQRRDSSRRLAELSVLPKRVETSLDPAGKSACATEVHQMTIVGPDGIRRPIGNRAVRVFIPFGGAKRLVRQSGLPTRCKLPTCPTMRCAHDV